MLDASKRMQRRTALPQSDHRASVEPACRNHQAVRPLGQPYYSADITNPGQLLLTGRSCRNYAELHHLGLSDPYSRIETSIWRPVFILHRWGMEAHKIDRFQIAATTRLMFVGLRSGHPESK